MKLQIDTVEKTVTLTEDLSLYELLKELMMMFPEEWKKYTIKPVTVYVTANPVIEPIPYTYPWLPPWNPQTPYTDPYKVTCGTDPTDTNYNTTK
jgi:hypothetical protein